MLNVYIYDSTFSGILSAVFDAWADKSFHDIRAVNENGNVSLIENHIVVDTCENKADRISRWLKEKAGEEPLQRIYRTFLTERGDRGLLIFRYLKLVAKEGKKTDDNLAHPDIIKIFKADSLFTRETGRLTGFLRFNPLVNGILFAEMAPEYNQLEMIAPFFADRYLGNPWIIRDTIRNTAAIFDGRHFIISEAGSEVPFSEGVDGSYSVLWKNYLSSLTIKERMNLELQRKHVPKKIRKYMTEFC